MLLAEIENPITRNPPPEVIYIVSFPSYRAEFPYRGRVNFVSSSTLKRGMLPRNIGSPKMTILIQTELKLKLEYSLEFTIKALSLPSCGRYN